MAVPCDQCFLLHSVSCGCWRPSPGRGKLSEDREHEDLPRQRLAPPEMQGQKLAACTMIYYSLDSEGDFQNLTLVPQNGRICFKEYTRVVKPINDL